MCSEQRREEMTRNRTLIGDVISIVDGVVFLLATMTSRKFSYISPPEYIFIRCAYQVLIAGYLKFKGRNFTLYTAANWKPYIGVMLTGLLGVMFNLIYLYCLKHIPPADMFALHKLKIIITGIFSMFLFGDVFGTLEFSAACVIVSGEVIISQPSFIFGGESSAYGELTSLQWCAAASTAVISGLQPVFLRYAVVKGSKDFRSDVSDYLLHFGVFGLLSLHTLYSDQLMQHRKPNDLMIISTYAFFAIGGSSLFKISLDYISSTRYAVVNCAVVPISFVLDAIAGTGVLRASGVFGAFIVTFGVVFFSLVQYYRKEGLVRGTWLISIGRSKH